MMFWGVEVKAKEELEVLPYDQEYDYVHISQVSLGESAKDGERVFVKVKHSDIFSDEDEDEPKEEDVEPTTVVLGVLHKGKVDHMSLDLVFDRPFTLFHSGSAPIYFSGYKTKDPEMEGDFDMDAAGFGEEDEDDDEEGEESDEEAPKLVEGSKSAAVALAPKAAAKGGEGKKETKKETKEVKAVPKKEEKATKGPIPAKKTVEARKPVEMEVEDDEDDDDEDEMDATNGLGNDDDLADMSGDEIDDDEDDESDEDEEEEPKPVPAAKAGAKRPAVTTPPPGQKKAKNDTPAAKGAKPGATPKSAPKPAAPTKTPTPAKPAVGKAATASKVKPAKGSASPSTAPKPAAGGFSCGPCNKKFNSEQALSAHKKSKHDK